MSWSLSQNKQLCKIYHVQLHQLYIGRTALWFEKILTFNHIWWQYLYIKILSKLFWFKLTFEHVLEKSITLLHVDAIVMCLYIHRIISYNHLTTCTLIYPIQSKHRYYWSWEKYTKKCLEEHVDVYFLLAYGVHNYQRKLSVKFLLCLIQPSVLQ